MCEGSDQEVGLTKSALLIILGPGMWGGLMSVVRLLLYSILGGLSDWAILVGGGGVANGYNIRKESRKCVLR